MGGGGKKSGKMEVTDYRLSLHYGICHGPVDEILGIIIGEKEAWSGSLDEEDAITIHRPDLFGGPKKEGGVAGTAYFLPGSPTQVLPENLAARLGKTSATAPGYRSIASLFMVGGMNSYSGNVGQSYNITDRILKRNYGGFLWSTNNPYLKGTWIKVKRSPKVFDLGLRMIGTDANPATHIYECLINRDWGMGGAPSTIDTDSFISAAETLKAENFGLSLQWTKQSTIEDYVSEILDHIQATMFVNPRTGLMTLKLIRNDYTVAALPTLTPDNCEVTSFDRKAWGETINEIVVTWTNPENEQEETVTAQNLANIEIQGAVISDSRNYYGVRNSALAMRLAMRDLATASSPLAAFEIEVDRTAWDFVPGGCVRLYYPEYGIDGLVLRVLKIEYGKPGDATIKVSAIEDIFANTSASFEDPTGTEWEDPAEDPAPMEYVRVITAPSYFVSRLLSAGDASVVEYADVLSAILASQTGEDTAFYELIGTSVDSTGETIATVLGTKNLLGYTELEDPLSAEAQTLVPTFGDVLGGPGPRIGGFLFIGNKAEEGQEIALIQSADETGWFLLRGVLDTVPRDWPVGTAVWFVSLDSQFIDEASVYAAGQEINYKLLSITSKGTLSIDDAPLNGAVLSARPHLPNRPAGVTAGGVAFGTADLSGSTPSVVAVTWKNRNRELEDAQVLGWTENSLPVETGQTTTITVINQDGDVVTTHDGLTGESFNVPVASFGPYPVCDIKVTSKRDGLESLQGHVIRVKIRDGGYGDNYGDNYGTAYEVVAGDPDPGDPGSGYEPDPGGEFPDYPEFPIPFL